MRQNNIVWLVFLPVFAYVDAHKYSFKWNLIKHQIKKSKVFILGFLLFLIFIFLNKGIAIGDRSMHPTFSFYLGNVYFILFTFFFLFFPLNISKLPVIISKIKNKKIILLLAGIFILYLFTFTNTHPYNQITYNFFLRNKILVYFTSSLFLKIIFFLPIAYSILSLSVIKLSKKSFYLIYPFTFLFLIPSWLIEQRYYLVPFVLFMLCCKKEEEAVEYISLFFYIFPSLFLFYGILTGKFFL